jgi:hypothetical protein
MAAPSLPVLTDTSAIGFGVGCSTGLDIARALAGELGTSKARLDLYLSCSRVGKVEAQQVFPWRGISVQLDTRTLMLIKFTQGPP